MDSNNDDTDDTINLAMTYLRRRYDPSNATDTLTIRTSWIRTVHRAAQVYLHQMTSSSTDEGLPTLSGAASNITEKDILYAYIWHLFARARVRGATNSTDPTDPTEVVKLFTTVGVHDVSFPPRFGPPRQTTLSSNQEYLGNFPSAFPVIVTAPLHQFFLQPAVTDKTAIPRLRRYALLASAIRSAIEEAVQKPEAVQTRLGLLRQVQHEGQQREEGQEVAPRQAMVVKKDGIQRCKGELFIVSLEDVKGLGYSGSYGRRMTTVETGSEMISSLSEEEVGSEVHTGYTPSTPATGDYHAIVLPVREGGGKWRVQLHLHPLDRQWLRRWVDENPWEAEMVPRV